ncbi:MAG TPA: transaldolase family protein, partial [Gemmataceae bacterium]|nr:transaldolase family protein [Gemmataceae bacterium]
MTPLESLVACGTKLWLDSVDPDEIATNRAFGATGATSNPIIISDLIQTGRFDADLKKFLADGLNDEAIAWALTDKLVKAAQAVFEPVWREKQGDDGWVSFELDPLLEDPARNLPVAERTKAYIEL